MTETPARLGSRFRFGGVLLAASLIVLAPQAAVLGTRLISTVQRGTFDETTGSERVPIYGVWKARHGYPVYEQPYAGNFYPALYNFGFYRSYGAFARLVGADDAALVTVTRLLTCAFTLTGALFWALTLRALQPDDGSSDRRWVWAAAFAVWFSSAGVSWFYVTIRPDMASMACAFAGLWAYVRGQSRSSWLLLGAGLLFAAAWSFKTSTIGVLGGVCVYEGLRNWRALNNWRILRRTARALLCVGGPPVLLALVALSSFGEHYRFNMLTLPTTTTVSLVDFAVGQALRVFGPNPLLFVIPLVALLRPSEQREQPEDRRGLLLSVSCVSLLVGTAALMRGGGSRNSLLEGYLAFSLASAYFVPLAARVAGRSRAAAVVVTIAILVTVAYPVTQLASAGRLGATVVSSRLRYEEGRVIASALQRVPKPLYSEDYLFAEPWFSNDGKYPSLVIDPVIYRQARAAGLMPVDNLESAIGRREIPSLLLTDELASLKRAAEEADYLRIPISGVTTWNVSLYVAPERTFVGRPGGSGETAEK